LLESSPNYCPFKAVEIVAKDKGKPIDQVVNDVIDHLTPGAPNSPALS
jgi:hypothetical protein